MDYILKILNEQKEPMTLNELHTALAHAGIVITQTNLKKNLSAYVRSGELLKHAQKISNIAAPVTEYAIPSNLKPNDWPDYNPEEKDKNFWVRILADTAHPLTLGEMLHKWNEHKKEQFIIKNEKPKRRFVEAGGDIRDYTPAKPFQPPRRSSAHQALCNLTRKGKITRLGYSIYCSNKIAPLFKNINQEI